MSDGLSLGQTVQPVWQSRTGNAVHPFLATIGNSTVEDLPFVNDDIAGSIAHVAGLHAAGLLEEDEAAVLIDGLQELAHDQQKGEWTLDPALEDLHMNIESALRQRLGDVADKLHTGRSRNDQVATAIVLHARRRLFELAEALAGLQAALAETAEAHLHTPWTARTHGQSAQPATLGFLLVAHAVRVSRSQDHVLNTLAAINECPLGAGAVAGSTLPLKPEVAARLLGLDSLENALVASGSRDSLLLALAATAQTGPVLAGLATDLLQLHTTGHYTPPKGLTTGSSLMPQKRNPDGLELARAHANSLSGHLQTVHQVIAGLGLGYQRDLQLTKPPLVKGLSDAITTTRLLTVHIEAECFTPFEEAKEDAEPANMITATDVAEVLVSHGTPFRSAYRMVAEAASLQEQQDTSLTIALEEILQANHVPENVRTACSSALLPDPARRNTRGGPAPDRVAESLDRMRQRQQAREKIRLRLATELGKTLHLLGQSSEMILAQARTNHPPDSSDTAPEKETSH